MVGLITDVLLTRTGGSVRNAQSTEKELEKSIWVWQDLSADLMTELLKRKGVVGDDFLQCGPGIAGVYLHLLYAKLPPP